MKTRKLALALLLGTLCVGHAEPSQAANLWQRFTTWRKQTFGRKSVTPTVTPSRIGVQPPTATLTPAAPLVKPVQSTPAPVIRQAPAPVITSATVSASVSAARSARFTASFDATWAETVKTIKAYSAAGNVIAAQESAVQALHAYFDHHNVRLDGTPWGNEFFARQYAQRAGLADLLGW
ncbi:MAG: hypothetical protein IT371_04860 [Deltaproteobacteria bacterium]|nr:hypothetical protein [Deltaproteobacteria bacterium]